MYVSIGVGLGMCARVGKGFFCVGIVPLEALKNGSFGLSDILFVACTAGYAVYQVRASACEVFLTCIYLL